MKKRLLSLLLASCFGLSLLPTTALAAADPITVHVTISNQGAIPVGKNHTLMAQVPVKVSDLDGNGSFSYDEAMVAAHSAYYEGLDSGYAAAENYCTELWGETEGVGGFYRNNEVIPNGVTADTVSDGDYLTAFVYADQEGWSDQYGYFNQNTAAVKTGQTLTLHLSGAGYDSDWNPVSAPVANASVGYWDAAGAFQELNQSTGSDGSVTLSFPEAGTYVISAYGNDAILVPPVCTVTVTETGLSDGVKQAVANCVSGYQGSECTYKSEWALLGRVRALSGTEGWTTRDADIRNYVASVEQAVKSGSLSRDTVPTTIERVILALTAVGMDVTDFCGENLTQWLYGNPDGIADYSSNDLIWALIALDSGDYTAPEGYRDSLIEAMAQYQNDDGGFFFSASWSASDVDMTHMALIALHPYQEHNAAARKMYQAGLSYVEGQVSGEGNYGNSCNDAYGVIAKCTLGQSGDKLDKLVRYMLDHYLVEEGFTYNGELNGMATYEGLMAMGAYQRLSAGESGLFDLTDVEKQPISVAKPKVSGSYTYTGGKQTVKITKSDFYTLSGTTSATGVGTYTVTASLNDRVNTAWSDGSTADVTLTWSIGKKPMSKLTYSGISSQTYTGKSLKPKVTVKNGSKTLKSGTDYTVAYSGNRYVGTAKITITGRGSYTGTKIIRFKIVPKKTSLSSVKNVRSRKLSVKWKRNTTVSGYQIQYYTSKSGKDSRTVTVKGYKSTSKTLSRLTKKKWYYVRIRGYKKVSGTTYYSGWSSAKAAKINR